MAKTNPSRPVRWLIGPTVECGVCRYNPHGANFHLDGGLFPGKECNPNSESLMEYDEAVLRKIARSLGKQADEVVLGDVFRDIRMR